MKRVHVFLKYLAGRHRRGSTVGTYVNTSTVIGWILSTFDVRTLTWFLIVLTIVVLLLLRRGHQVKVSTEAFECQINLAKFEFTGLSRWLNRPPV